MLEMMITLFCVILTTGGGGHSLIWPIGECIAEQGMVFRVLSLEQGI